MVGICKIRGLIPMEIVAGKRPLSNVQLSWMWRRCRGREKRVVSGGKERERERSSVVGEKKVQGSRGRGCDKEKTEG